MQEEKARRKNSNTLISRFNYQSEELQIGKPLSLKAAIVMSVNELSALILSGGFKLASSKTWIGLGWIGLDWISKTWIRLD